MQFACCCDTEEMEGRTREKVCSYLQLSSRFAPVGFLLQVLDSFFIALLCQKLQFNSIGFVCVDRSNEHNPITALPLRD